MPRRYGWTSRRPPETNSSASPLRMRPRLSRISPATMLTIEVLPEPDGPNRAVTPPAASNFAATAKSPSRFSTSTASISFPVDARAHAPREPLGEDQRDQRDDDRDDDQPPRCGVGVGDLHIGVDRGRDGLRLAGNVRHKGDRGAELAQRLGEAQHHPGDNT